MSRNAKKNSSIISSFICNARLFPKMTFARYLVRESRIFLIWSLASHNNKWKPELDRHTLCGGKMKLDIRWILIIIFIQENKILGIISTTTIGKPSEEKKSAYVWIFSKRLWPPPRCIFGTLWGTFLKPYFIWTKVPQSVWILVIHPHFPWKMSNPKQKKVPHHLWNQATLPPRGV